MLTDTGELNKNKIFTNIRIVKKMYGFWDKEDRIDREIKEIIEKSKEKEKIKKDICELRKIFL